MRKSTLWFCCLLTGCLLLSAALGHAALERKHRASALSRTAGLVRTLELTDLCLFTEARYTRHPTQADLATAFQDHPLSFEHFPSGSLLEPVWGRRGPHADLD
jgi:hypothetical protein